MLPLPLAVHIDDGILTSAFLAAGWAITAVFVFVGAWRIRDEEIPQIAVLSAAFFVASLIPIPVPARPHTHLLLNGLLGVVLGRRAFLAVPVGLFLQAILFGHGGLLTLGVNSVVMGVPALASWLLFAGLRRLPWVRHPWFRTALVAASFFTLGLSLVYGVVLLCTNPLSGSATLDLGPANYWTFHPLTLLGLLLLATLSAWGERRLENAPEFPLGLVIGEAAVLLTVLLNSLALLWGGQEDFRTLALITFVVHLPLAVFEGVVLGFLVGFLMRVKPEVLRWSSAETEEPQCAVESVR